MKSKCPVCKEVLQVVVDRYPKVDEFGKYTKRRALSCETPDCPFGSTSMMESPHDVISSLWMFLSRLDDSRDSGFEIGSIHDGELERTFMMSGNTELMPVNGYGPVDKLEIVLDAWKGNDVS